MTDPSPNAVVVGCAADEGFAMPLAVLVRSILDHLSPTYRLVLYTVDIGILPQTRERLLESWPADRIETHWLTVDAKELSHLPVWGRMNIATYQRLLMGRLLPESVKRVIWLDADALALEDLSRLWEIPLDGRTIAASQDLVVPYVSSRFGIERFRELGLPADAPHFNAGVMLVDLDLWREDRVAEQSLEYLAKHAQEVWFWDQEALNVVLLGKWKLLDPRWNQIAGVAGRWFFRAKHLDAAAYRQVVDSPWIVHWAGSIKPWKFRSRRILHCKWFEYLDHTAWRGWRPERNLANTALGLYVEWGRNLMYQFEPILLKAQKRRRG